MKRFLPRAALLAPTLLAVGLVSQTLHARGAAAQTPRRAPTVEEWMSLKTADAPRISPDGRAVVYTVSEADWNADSYDNELWIASVAAGERRQLTSGKGSSWSPRWSPDGTRLAFLSTREGAPQIYLTSPAGGDAVRLTRAEGGVGSFEWSPDGRRIAYTSGEARARGGGRPREEAKEFRVVGEEPIWTSSLWLVEVPAASSSAAPPAALRLTDGDGFAADDFAWSPDSRRIAVSANDPAHPHPFWTYDIYVVEVAERTVRKIVETPGADFFPVWSPDGREIAYRTYVRPNSGDEYTTFSNGYVAAVPAVGGAPRVLTEQFDENPTPLAWSPDGIYFSARQRTFQHLFRLDPATKAIKRVSEPAASVNFAFSFTKDLKQAAFVSSDARSYQEVYVSSLGQFRPRRLTDMGAQLKGWGIATREIINWTSEDATPVEGVLVKPRDFDPARKYPLLVIVHTGPAMVDQATIDRDLPYIAEMFAQRGALVLRPNYRGSVGYGQRFRALLAGNLGEPQYWDIISGVDHLIGRGVVERGRVGVMGWSHGGYIAAFITAFSDRFKAASVGQGVSDLRFFYTYGAGHTIKPSPLEPTPWDAPEAFRAASPLTYVKRAKTPTLIQHGEADQIAPVGGAYELRRALLDQGVPVRMIVYKGAGHLPSGLRQTRAVAEHNLEWFDRWIWGKGGGG
ncbi:MAG TPA: S9 family peptidase [Pyrinomonadaceae bacterium]|nr:S9 family peptidase [Pyrinomonadaceae bacterium]